MANRFYALSRQAIVLQKVSVWGKMLMVVAAATLGTETVSASNPNMIVPFNEVHSLHEAVDSLGYAGLQVEAPRPHQSTTQRWVF
ncbi:hypothetical protein [Pseudomonas mucidolens]|uniref:Uncharacterized protein n=1 Tax=Pseudomonas mucidolens TaxID=46679 RepID=A0A1H2NT56_9PSED|nr:hypothetical protein [Pseudomonas mucidolens]SDV08612.1 hypothetical protein SAMN05216202_4612 [Pseudomonas mucidolens]SQH31100.1 Uncharacterised protein [Pseudomonas mucidolens]